MTTAYDMLKTLSIPLTLFTKKDYFLKDKTHYAFSKEKIFPRNSEALKIYFYFLKKMFLRYYIQIHFQQYYILLRN